MEYERGKRNGLIFIHTRCLSRDGLGAIRGFYRGVFQSGGWVVGNVEYDQDRWTFLVIHGEREATIGLEPRPPNSEIDIRFSKRQPVRRPVPVPAPVPVPEHDEDLYESDDGGWDD